MPITLPHFLGLMAHPGVDQTLVNALGGTVGSERMAENVPTSELVPLTATNALAKSTAGFTLRNRQDFRLWRLHSLSEQFQSTGVPCEPFLKNRSEQRWERNMTIRAMTATPFFLADENLLGLKVDVSDPRSHNLGTPSPGESRETEHGINERRQRLTVHVVKQFLNLRHGEKNAVPQIFLLGRLQREAGKLSLDFFPGLERRFLLGFRIDQAFVGKRARHQPCARSPIPDGSEAADFFANRDGTELSFSDAIFLGPLADV